MDVSHLNVKPARGKIDKEALNITRSRVEPLKVNKEKEKAAKVSHFTCNSPIIFAEVRNWEFAIQDTVVRVRTVSGV